MMYSVLIIIKQATSTFILLTLLLAAPALANLPPTKPGNLEATVLSSTTIELNWDASSDDKRVRYYRVLINSQSQSTTRATSFTLENLQPDTEYTFEVDASDGKAFSYVATVSATTAANEPVVEQPSPAICKGKNNKLPECQTPPAEETPTEETPTEETPTEETPTEEPPTEEPPAVAGVPEGWSVVFEDDFDGSGDIDVTSQAKNWRFETLVDGLHRAGNSGMDENGVQSEFDWRSPSGKRWSGWYNKYNTDNAYRFDGNLIMQGLSSGEPDPTRQDTYIDNGVQTEYGTSKLYTAWLDTWSRKYENALGRHITDPSSPNKLFKYGYFEARVNFSQMITPGFRLSMWLMPASLDKEGNFLVESNAYDSDGNNGVEIDIFEYEWIGKAFENRIQLSIHGGAAGGSSVNFDTEPLGIAMHEGWHTIALLWQENQLVWLIDGQVVKTVTNENLIPDVYSYLILSREMNSGVKRAGVDYIEDGDAIELLPYRPRDPGLYAQNIWEFRDRLATDQALIDYVRVWQPQ